MGGWGGRGEGRGVRGEGEEKQEINIVSNPNHQVLLLHTSAPKYD